MSEKFVFQESKSSWEKFFVEVDASLWLGEETITGVVYSAKTSDGTDVTSTLLDSVKNTNTTTSIKPYIRGGVSGTQYIVLLRASSSGDNHREFAIELSVLDN